MRTRTIALAAFPLAVLLAGCTPGSPPPNPTIGQTWQAPGNEDTCVWNGGRWAEIDDGEDCGWELDDEGHATKRRTVTVAPPTRTTATRRTATTRTVRSTAPTRRTR